MQRLLLATIGLALVTSTATAGGYGQSRYGYAGGYGQYGQVHHNVNPYIATQTGGHLHWHDTSHYDYVPTRIVRPGFLYRVQPRGYYFHQDGHWDLHR